MSSTANHRLRVYKALATAFYFPNTELGSSVQELKEGLASLGLSIFEEDLDALERFFAENKRELAAGVDENPLAALHSASTCECSNAKLEVLMTEYCKLFYGPGKLLAPPYESVYRDRDVAMGESTINVIKVYSEAGIAVSPDFKNLPDHIAAELEFMYYLCAKEAETFEKGDLKSARHYLLLQKLFLKEHLTQWLPRFTKRIEEHAKSAFYRSLARIVVQFAEIDSSDTATLKELTHAVRLLEMAGK